MSGKRITKMKKRDKYLIISVIMIVLYCVATFIASCYGKAIPDVLTTCWFAAWTVELALLAGIKIKDKGE